MMVSVMRPGVIQVFDFSSEISLRNFYAVYPPHTNAATSLSFVALAKEDLFVFLCLASLACFCSKLLGRIRAFQDKS